MTCADAGHGNTSSVYSCFGLPEHVGEVEFCSQPRTSTQRHKLARPSELFPNKRKVDEWWAMTLASSI